MIRKHLNTLYHYDSYIYSSVMEMVSRDSLESLYILQSKQNISLTRSDA